MKTFVEEYVDSLKSSAVADWANLTIVVPNKLVAFYIQKALRSKSENVTWAPEICTLPELAVRMAQRDLCGTSQSLMYLLDAYKKSMPAEMGTIQHFMKWGQKIHSDFIDVCATMADARLIYRDLRSVKEVEHWQIGEEELTASQRHFLVFWNALETIFEQWKHSQEEEGRMVYPVLLRFLLNNSRLWSDDWSGKRIDVVGIAGFQKSEEMLLQMLGLRSDVRVIWDADRFYVENNWHEAGHAIRRHSNWLELDRLPNFLAQREVKMYHHRCDSFHGQCGALAHNLLQMPPEELAQSAVLLPDETWLAPVLQILAGQGLLSSELATSLQFEHPLKRWISTIMRVHLNRRFKSQGYYVRDLMEILDLSKGWLLTQESAQRLQDKLIQTSKGYWNYNALKGIGWFEEGQSDWAMLFFPKEDRLILDEICSLIERLFVEPIESVQRVMNALHHLQATLVNHPEATDLQVICWLWSMEELQLKAGGIHNRDGNLQVLLMTDTRALDFKHVFIPGLNEGVIPKKSTIDSFIPLDIRAAHKMSLPKDAEASFSYVFYRLIQRAETFTMFSSAVDEQRREQEVSRYLLQLKAELLRANPKMKCEESFFRFDLPFSPKLQLPVNDSWSRSRIEELIQQGLSASALNKFKDCPLDFYFRYIAKVGEVEEIDDTISDAEMGSLAHSVLEYFYKRFLNSYPKSSDFDTIIEQLDDQIDEAIINSKKRMDLDVGNNALIRFTTKTMLERYFQFEKRALANYPLSREIIAVELDFNFVLDEKTNLRLRGKIDRVERMGDTIRILDYKTGQLHKKDYILTPNKKGQSLFDHQSGKMIQIVTYMMAAQALYGKAQRVEAGFISFRNMNNGWQMFQSNLPSSVWQSEFVQCIVGYIESMRALTNWEHAERARYCEYCLTLGFDMDPDTDNSEETTEETSNEESSE